MPLDRSLRISSSRNDRVNLNCVFYLNPIIVEHDGTISRCLKLRTSLVSIDSSRRGRTIVQFIDLIFGKETGRTCNSLTRLVVAAKLMFVSSDEAVRADGRFSRNKANMLAVLNSKVFDR